jgi:hypothetical protein
MNEKEMPQAALNETGNEMIQVLRACGFHVRTSGLLDHQRPQVSGPLDAAITLFKLTVAAADVGGHSPGNTPNTAVLQFLTDVVTAAGLLSHGRTDRELAKRMSAGAYDMRAILYGYTDAGDHNSQSPNCSCPSGNGGLRWPCPIHPPEAVAHDTAMTAQPSVKGGET